MQYILFVHNNVVEPTTSEQWGQFFEAARRKGVFKGGSAINPGLVTGVEPQQMASSIIAGYMLFNSDDVKKIHEVLKLHPVVIQGGTVELCEAPKT